MNDTHSLQQTLLKIIILLCSIVCCLYGTDKTGIFFRAEAASKAAVLLDNADECRKSLDKSPARKKYRHNWFNCIRQYEKIYEKYPESSQAPWALYHAGKMYKGLYEYSFLSKDLDKAIDLFERLAGGYENHRLADDAQYLIGEIVYKFKKNPSQAYVEFLKVDIKFPSGDMRPRARKMLDKLAVTLSKDKIPKSPRLARKQLPRKKSAEVKDIRHWSTPSYTRVVVDLEHPIKYEHHLLDADPGNKKPRRIYLDLNGAHVGPDISDRITIKDGLLQRARAGQYRPNTVRVVLDMMSVGEYKVFHLHDPFRIVADVRRIEKEDKRDADRKKKQAPGEESSKTPETERHPPASLASQLGLNVRTIVIDPGHGGKDPGCHSGSSIKEKNIVLAISRKVAREIKAKIGCNVIFTRDRDEYLPLERRTAIANMKKADLFISLHVNAHKSRSVQGVETYFLNMATDERAVMVAARENATSEKNISDLQTILNDLMLNTKINESSRLALEVQKSMVSRIKGHYKVRDLGVKKAPFYVLIGAQMPAILIETGFITNSTEKRRLLSEKYQNIVAQGITDGVLKYIESIDRVYQGG